jgi:FkbM family methyltransferase
MQNKFFLMDIGARGDIQYPFNLHDNLSLILVEPDPEESEYLIELYSKKTKDIKILPYALWSNKSILSLNLTKSPGASSILLPNSKFLNQFPEKDRFDIVREYTVNTSTIDELYGDNYFDRIDFVKIDVQGSELNILKGGNSFLKSNIIGIEVEVEFSELYSNQPLFSDVDKFIREELGLELWDLARTYWKYKNKNNYLPTKGKMVFGDALYLRPIIGLDNWLSKFNFDIAKSKLLALIDTALMYGYTDYASAIIEHEKLYPYFNSNELSNIIKDIKRLGKGLHFTFKWSHWIYYFLLGLANIFKPIHKNWAIRQDICLGSKKKFGFWF